jgi:hypothetical protein
VFTLMVTPVFYILVTRAADRLGLKTIPPRVDLVQEQKEEGGAT